MLFSIECLQLKLGKALLPRVYKPYAAFAATAAATVVITTATA
jgi:hypothetical protein